MSDIPLQHGGFSLLDWKRADSVQIRDPVTDELRKTIFPTHIEIGYKDEGPLHDALRANLTIQGTLYVSQSNKPSATAQFGDNIKIFHALSDAGKVDHIGFGLSSDAGGGQFGIRSFAGTMQFRDIDDASWTDLDEVGSARWTATTVGSHIYPNSNRGAIFGDITTAKANTLIEWTGQTTFNEQAQSVDFRVESSGLQSAIFVDGANNGIILADASATPSLPGVDTNLSVAGTVASRGTSTRGTSVLGGDVVISGSLHGGSPLQIGSYRTDLGSDVTLWVSGSTDLIGKPASERVARGVSVFGGDLVVSGVLLVSGSQRGGFSYSGGTISGSIHHTQDGLSYLVAGSNVTITSASNGQLTIESSGGGSSLSSYSENGSFSTGQTASGTDSVAIGENSTASGNYSIVGGGVNNTVSADFGTVGGGVSNTVSGGGDGTVSGGSQNTASGQYSTVGGGNSNTASDTVATVGGGFTNSATGPLSTIAGGYENTASGYNATVVGLSGSTASGDGTAVIGTNIEASEKYTIHIGGGAEGSNYTTVVTSSLFKVGGGFAHDRRIGAGYLPGTDVNFFVSGSMGSQGSTSIKGTSLFGGDLVVSGALRVGKPGAGQQVIFHGNDSLATGLTWSPDGSGTPGTDDTGGALILGENTAGVDFLAYGDSVNNYMLWKASDNELRILGNQQHWGGNVIFNDAGGDYDFRVENQWQVGALLIDGGTGQIGLLTDGTRASNAYGLNASTDPIPQDVNLFVSGAVGSRDSFMSGTAVFGGDLVVSGALLVSGAQRGGFSYSGGTISGSIHHTQDGLSYLVAGSNVTITSASNGQLTIESSGGTSLSSYSENGSFSTGQTASGTDSVAIGDDSTASGQESVVGGGKGNTASGTLSTVAGGGSNTAGNNARTTVGGGYLNVANADSATIAGGYANEAIGNYSFVGGGLECDAKAQSSVTCGGQSNINYGHQGFLGGGVSNAVGSAANSANAATLVGGDDNTIDPLCHYSTLVGGTANIIGEGATYGFLGGGDRNGIAEDDTTSTHCVLGGGGRNLIGGGFDYATIVGGLGNKNHGSYSFVGGGFLVTSSGDYSVVAGGYRNLVDGDYSFVGGGLYNTASGGGISSTVVAGGRRNYAFGFCSAILGSSGSTALGDGAIAVGTELTASEKQTVHIGGGAFGSNYTTVVTSSLFKVGGGFANDRRTGDGFTPGTDVSFFVSGSGGSRGSSIIRGTSLFGGDVAVSGSLNIHNSVTFHEEWDNGNSGATATILWLTQKQKITLTSATVTLTFTAPVGVGNFLLKVVQDGSGSRTVTWPAAVLWPGGSAPTLSTAASSVDIVSFYYDGSNYYGVASLAFA